METGMYGEKRVKSEKTEANVGETGCYRAGKLINTMTEK